MISRVIKCWIWLANRLLVLSMTVRWMHCRPTRSYMQTYRDRQHSCSSCLIKRFVWKRECDGHTVTSKCVFFNKLSLSRLNILWPYRGQYILVASFVPCQHDQGKHPLGLSLSFFISLSSSFHPPFLHPLSRLLILFHTLSILILSLFSVSEMKASPQLLSLLLKRPKWGSLSDEFSPVPLQTETDRHTHTRTHTHTHTHTLSNVCLSNLRSLTPLAHTAIKEASSAHVHTLFEVHNSLMHRINICIGR